MYREKKEPTIKKNTKAKTVKNANEDYNNYVVSMSSGGAAGGDKDAKIQLTNDNNTNTNCNLIMLNGFDGRIKTNEYSWDFGNITNQVYRCLNNAELKLNNNMDEYRFNSNSNSNIIEPNHDLLWISSNNLPTTSNNYFEFPYVQISNTTDTNVQVQEGLQFLNILHHHHHQDQEALIVEDAEYIDINILNRKEENDMENLVNIDHGGASEENHNEDDEDDDDVIFVKEYYINNAKNKQSERRNNKKKIITTEPRRNPKRQVQLQKASIELALKLTNKEANNSYNNSIRTRRATKITDIVSSF